MLIVFMICKVCNKNFNLSKITLKQYAASNHKVFNIQHLNFFNSLKLKSSMAKILQLNKSLCNRNLLQGGVKET